MITSLLLLATVAGPVGFDHTAHVSWAAGDGQTRAKGVVDSSASELGARGIRLRAEAKTPRGWLGVLDLDLTPSTVGPLNVGPELRARYDELTPKGVGFHGGKATGTVVVDRLVRDESTAHVQMTLDLVFTDADGQTRKIVGTAYTLSPPKVERRDREVYEGPGPEAEVEVVSGCDGTYVEDDDYDGYDDRDWAVAGVVHGRAKCARRLEIGPGGVHLVVGRGGGDVERQDDAILAVGWR